jgi:hypothetical protein
MPNGIADELYARYSEAQWNEWLTSRPGSAEVRLHYRRPNGDLTSALPSTRHRDYWSRGWVAVSIVDDDLEREINEARMPKAPDIFPRQATTAKAEKSPNR